MDGWLDIGVDGVILNLVKGVFAPHPAPQAEHRWLSRRRRRPRSGADARQQGSRQRRRAAAGLMLHRPRGKEKG